MASSIPYDHPSLVLGNLVDTQVLNLFKQISSIQSRVDAAQERMNSLIMMKRSLAMTINELTDMNVDVSDIKERLGDIDSKITKSATDYMTVRMDCEEQIQQLREQISELETSEGMESPLDFSRSQIKRLPLSAESLKLDAQYFSYGSNQEDDTIANIEKYVRESTSNLGSKSGEIAKTASSQVSQQKQNHNLAGTLIITASCTHRNVAVIDPFILDVDKAIAVWNSIYSTEEDKIKTSDPNAVRSISEKESSDEKSMTAISGVSYGSSFVGMVHMLKTDFTGTALNDEVYTQIQEKMKMGGWLENASGGFGVDPSITDEVKKILSTQNISSHVSMIVMGAAPSIASNQLQLGVNKVIQPDPEKLRSYLTVLDQSMPDSESTIETNSKESQKGNRLLYIQSETTKNIMQQLGNIDHGSNKIIDINSMMSAFENYLQSIKTKDESLGIPINFYLKKISRSQLANLWINKYYPEKENIVTNTTTK